jgi:hypothetical protein
MLFGVAAAAATDKLLQRLFGVKMWIGVGSRIRIRFGMDLDSRICGR